MVSAAVHDKISIIIPARNEEAFLPQCLEAINAAKSLIPNEVEIIIVLNRCEDRTEEIAKDAGAILVYEDAKNLSVIRNAGARAASGAIIMTIDADSIMSRNMLSRVAAELSNPRVVGGGVLMIPSRFSLGIILTGLCILPIAIYHRISGGVFFARKEDFDRLGGFDESLSSVEDIDFAKRLRQLGKDSNRKFRNIFRSYITTSTRKFDRLGDWYFLKNPRLIRTLLTGRNQAAAERIWYDFER